jgi:hypothetical protein
MLAVRYLHIDNPFEEFNDSVILASPELGIREEKWCSFKRKCEHCHSTTLAVAERIYWKKRAKKHASSKIGTLALQNLSFIVNDPAPTFEVGNGSKLGTTFCNMAVSKFFCFVEYEMWYDGMNFPRLNYF